MSKKMQKLKNIAKTVNENIVPVIAIIGLAAGMSYSIYLYTLLA